jgi:hypothetical protein
MGATNGPSTPLQCGSDTVEMRGLKRLEIAARSKIVFDNGLWLVPSQANVNVKYCGELDVMVYWPARLFPNGGKAVRVELPAGGIE